MLIKNNLFLLITITLSIICLLITTNVHAESNKRYQFINKEIRVRVTPRSPQQMAAFYEGRGFSKKMVNALIQPCFFTVGIHNKTSDILWHDLSKWKFANNSGDIKHLDRAYWKDKWKKMQIPLAHQSTFRWTLLPESLDFRSNEHEGGNIILPYSTNKFTLQVAFKTKKDKSGKLIPIKIENIQCQR